MFSGKLLEKGARAARKIALMIEKGEEVSDRGYQKKLLKEILLYTASELEKLKMDRFKGPQKVFVFLPENVPVIPFQLLTLIETYSLEVLFKAPSSERLFYEILSKEMGLNFIWTDHEIALKKAKEFDFIIGFGEEGLGKILKNLGKPYRFFGPKFSIGVINGKNQDELNKVLLDSLSFDGEACLSPVFLFLRDIELEVLWEMMGEASRKRPPQKSFNKYALQYAASFLLYYSKDFKINKDRALFLVDKFPKFIPQRTIFVVKANTQEEILNFLGDKAQKVQGIITMKRPELLFSETSVSIVLPPGSSQFPSLTWFFRRGITMENFFSI